MTNVGRARELISQTRQAGVDEFCVCAGSRNSPLLAVLAASDVRAFSFVDERSAAFFALGRIKQHGKPVAVVTTSGTAVAELLPATVEAYYSSQPLLLITADRPARFRGTGAPQTIEQEAIFGPYAAQSLEGWDLSSPVHLNIEFDEPLIDEESGRPARSDRASRPIAVSRRAGRPATAGETPALPVVLIGGLAPEHRDRVRDFALQLNAPVYAEALSGLREDAALQDLLITSGERMISRGKFDGVIRIGSVPTLRFWRDLEESHRQLPVIHYSAARFAGLSRGEVESIDDLPKVSPRSRDEVFFERDRKQAAAFHAFLDTEPESELAIVRDLSRDLSPGTRVYLGNSLPIREWDLVATREPRGYVIEANRGANGIDGQVSTFLGWCTPGENVALIGDLTALYDLNALWIVPQLDEDVTFKIMVINNRGGRIFSRVPALQSIDRRLIENDHSLTFESWPAMFQLPYDNRDASRGIIELTPDAEASQRVWQRYDELWR